MTASATGAGNVNDFAALTALRKDARAQTPESLREAARQFESLFTKMMLDSMRKSSMGDELFGSDQADFYQGMFDDQLAVELIQWIVGDLNSVVLFQCHMAYSTTYRAGGGCHPTQ